MSASPARVVRATEGVTVGEVSNVCVVLWRGPVTRPRFDVQREGLAEVARRHREGIGLLCIVEPTSKPPGDELRRASADMVRDHRSALRCIACVVEGTGFANAIARSALSAMALLVGPRNVPLAVLGSVGAGAMWMAPHIAERDHAALTRSVESIRSELEAWKVGAP